MKTVIISGQDHKGSTYHIARMLADKIGGDTKEFFLPGDFGEFCTGCTGCFMRGEENCPHFEKLKPIIEAIDEADVIILDSPVYVYHVTGSMKAFLDHLGYRWMVHRPRGQMFKKQGVCISTAAGGGMKSANRDMADSLFHWGIPKIYKYGMAVAAISWEKVSEEKRRAIDKKTSRMAEQIKRNDGHVKPNIHTKGFFMICRAIQKTGYNPKDMGYWEEKG
ncbi:MAG: NAD(P)H-dependent oxidoreductase, partial [Lachnospiraceae bacterium]|nr:NAD(P)H-dependent oxidoreductase [Lachnospiraceae bacterium]